ncbi:unnamed protein product [Microthlaspi erraticum]|uniref:Uncharacterized protein n=1 Tax=Microthlaspi erraticum TaxID=1685480 RepID=A0A6D2KDR8_9BRAS|nr:unnamed protein product [Microthlaspi erraticum]
MIGDLLIGADEQSLPSSSTTAASLCSRPEPASPQGTDFSALGADLEDALNKELKLARLGHRRLEMWQLHDCLDTVLSKVAFRWEDILEDPLSNFSLFAFAFAASGAHATYIQRSKGRRHYSAYSLDDISDKITPRSSDLVWLSVEKYLAKPRHRNEYPFVRKWRYEPLFPAPSLEILLRLRFTAHECTPTTGIGRHYTTLKKMALHSAITRNSAVCALDGAVTLLSAVRQIFTVSLRLVGQGNRLLADEAASIAIWSLRTDVLCWEDWYNTYEENAEASEALLKTIVEKQESQSLVLSSSSSKHMKRFIQEMFTFSLRLAGKGISTFVLACFPLCLGVCSHRLICLSVAGKPLVAKEAAGMALWSLTQNVVCWKRWEYICQENVEASVALLKTLVEKCKDDSLKPSSSSSKAKRKAVQEIFTVSLRLAGKAKEAAEIAMWSLTQDVVCWKRWNYIYNYEEMNKEKVKEKMKEKILEKVMEKVNKVKRERNIKEMVKAKNKEKNIKEENIEASVALLKTLAERRNYHFLKQLVVSPSDTLTLTLTQTMESFRLKNKQAITEGGADGCFYKVADKSCKVILWRVSLGSISHKAAVVLAIAIGCLYKLADKSCKVILWRVSLGNITVDLAIAIAIAIAAAAFLWFGFNEQRQLLI